MKINSTKFDMVQEAIRKISFELDIDIFQQNIKFSDRNNPVIWGINWSAMGTKSISETKEFMANMQKAIEIAEFLNNCGFEIDWTESFEITEGTRDFWLSQIRFLKTAIENQKLDQVWDFVSYETN